MAQKKPKRAFHLFFVILNNNVTLNTTAITEIKTPRLRIIPLSYSQLKMYLQSDFKLENSLGVRPLSRYIPEELEEVLEEIILPAVLKSEPNHLFSTLWTLINEKENVLIGDLCFKGKVNKMGEIEIGYGTHEQFQNRGYMTEAILGMLTWLKNYPMVRVVTAETKTENSASIRTLEKIGFKLGRQSENSCYWYLNLP